MREITAFNGQSVYDIALLYCGDVSFAFPIAELNGIDINKTFDGDSKLMIPDDKNTIAKAYENEGVNFATGVADVWIMESGFWDDLGVWIDNKNLN